MTGIGSAEPGPAVVCTIVDVFAERPLSGNQLAVVRGGAHLDTLTMQAIALEMNFSETTFVVEERSDEARARIFTPVRELPFAGHPTLGTAWVLGRDRDSYTLDLPAGRVPVTFEAGGIAWMQPPPVEPGAVLSSQSAAALLGLLRSGGLLVAAYAATTLFDNSFMSLFPAFGLRLGLDEAEISLILSCLLLGGALAQVPIGWIIDRSSVFTALAACSLIGIAGFPLFAGKMPATKPAMDFAFLWDTDRLLGVQTIALAEMGKRYSRRRCIAPGMQRSP